MNDFIVNPTEHKRFRVGIIPVKDRKYTNYMASDDQTLINTTYEESISKEYTLDMAIVLEHYDETISTWIRDKSKRIKGTRPDYERCDSCFAIIPETKGIYLSPLTYDIQRPLTVCIDCYNSDYKHKGKSNNVEMADELIPSPPRSDNPDKKLYCPVCGHDNFDTGDLLVSSDGILRNRLRFSPDKDSFDSDSYRFKTKVKVCLNCKHILLFKE